MSKLANEYNNLFNYLEHYKKSSAKNTISQKEKKIKDIAAETNKLLEESQVHSYVPQLRKSSGFDVEKFENMMRSKMIDEFKRLQGYDRPYISVGELYTCLRQNYYTRLRYPVDIKQQFRFAYLYLIQRIGNEIHSVIQELYDFTETEKTVVSEKYKVKGRVDGLKEIYLYEIKSLDTEKFENKYVQEHYLQANIYAHILNTEYDYNIRKVVIVYVLRNLKTIIPFDLTVNESLAKIHLERAPLLHTALEKREPIDPLGATNEHCKYCPHKKVCKSDKCNEVIQPFMKKIKKKEKIQEEPKKSAFVL
jgi:CRISPR/Cas system-associated exonuclease Cas4 (RecB family)